MCLQGGEDRHRSPRILGAFLHAGFPHPTHSNQTTGEANPGPAENLYRRSPHVALTGGTPLHASLPKSTQPGDPTDFSGTNTGQCSLNGLFALPLTLTCNCLTETASPPALSLPLS